MKPTPTLRAPKPARKKILRGRTATARRPARDSDAARCRRYLQAITIALGVLSSAVRAVETVPGGNGKDGSS